MKYSYYVSVTQTCYAAMLALTVAFLGLSFTQHVKHTRSIAVYVVHRTPRGYCSPEPLRP